jgi:hypothetical protein
MGFRYSGKGWRVAGSLRTFGDQIMDARGHTNSYVVDGTLGNLEHSNRTSDHNPDENGIVRALDFFEHEVRFVDEIGEALRTSKDPRLKYFIHDTRMFSSYPTSQFPAWTWRPYTGVNGHETHGHLSVVATNVADQTHEWELNMALTAYEMNQIAEKVWFFLITDPITGQKRGAAHHVAQAYRYAHQAANSPVDVSAIAQTVVAEMSPGLQAAVAAELKKLTLKAQ